MQTINAVMLLLGCSHDASVCEATELNAPFYETVSQCEADIPAQQHFAEEGFPLTVVKCVGVDNLPAREAVKIEWRFNENGVLIAYAGPVDAEKQISPDARTLVAQNDVATGQ